jgi:magnesium chelatase subunit H
MQKPTTATDAPQLRIAVVTLDSHLSSTFARVDRQLQAKGIQVSLHAAGEWGRDEASLARCHEAIREADILVVTMLFMQEHIDAVIEPLRARREHCDAMICCMCAGDIVKLTRMGKFSMDGGDSRARAFFKRLRQSRSRKKSAGSGKLQMAMLRRIPSILRYIPGTAQDIRHYFLVLQYWLAGSDDNALNMVRMLVNHYADGERASLRGSLSFDLPREFQDIGLYHPALTDRMTDSVDALRRIAPLPAQRGTIGILLMRSYVLAGNTSHYDAVINRLESLGLRVLPAFASGLDSRPAIERYFMRDGKPVVDALLSLTGFSLVGGPAYNDAAAAEAMLTRLDVPYLAAMGLEFQTLENWQDSEQGLLPVESAMMVALPELDGAIHPSVFGGRSQSGADGRNTADMYPHDERVAQLCARVDRLVRLRNTPRSERRVAIVLFNFPPNAGSIGTAAHLSVFESVYNTLRAMQQHGYHVELPDDVDALRTALLTGNSAEHGSEANVHALIPVDDHVRRETWLEEIEASWGSAPGQQLSNGRGIQVLGRQFGNVLIGVQPAFGYEGDPMRLLFERSFAPTHAFSAFYRYLREDYNADAVLHFGTHGALEFMPGKQTGMSSECWPDRLIGDLPNYYLYAANNSAEGSIAKRRAGATLISYLTPPVTHAGLYKGLLDLRSSIDRWRASRSDETQLRSELYDVIISQAQTLELDIGSVTGAALIDRCKVCLDELEATLIPHGLHVVGEPVATEQRRDLLQAVAGVEAALQDCSADDIARQVDAMFDQPAEADAVIASCDNDRAKPILQSVQKMDRALQRDTEIPALMHALDGTYTAPVVGGDLLRAPEILPTGRNIHAFDPFRLPSVSAIQSGQRAAQHLLDRHLQDGHPFPETIAIVLWGTDNLKTEGSPIAQVLSLIGARPRFDTYGRLCGAELIDLSELGRPRIDVVVTLSGIFRDLLPQQTRLLAEAAWLAASAEHEPLEQNFVRKHALDYMQSSGCDLETAALRVFSNADGAYGSNVNHLIDDGSWSDENELADVFARRKSFAYGRHGDNVQQSSLFESILSRVELASQNLDSVEIGVTTIDHYFDTLGGISRCVQRSSDKSPSIYISDDTLGKAQVRTLSEQVEIETRTRLLNPKWYGQMLEHGHEGVRHIEAHISNTVGWSATTGQVKPWVYQQVTDTFMLDNEIRDRMTELNPEASMRMVNRLFEAHQRSYWQPDVETLAALQAVGEDLEDRLEGITEGVRA